MKFFIKFMLIITVLLGAIIIGVLAAAFMPAASQKSPLGDSSFFPLAVWLQDPGNAEKFKAIGINTYVGLWEGPTEQQLADLKQAGMQVICEQNSVGLKHKEDPSILTWMHGDEPDNAQSDGKGGYGPPIATDKIVAEYNAMKKNDPARPVLLNLGQGVAWDGWYGRGVRTNHPEDYVEYVKGADWLSFDIYPVNHDRPDVSNKLWMVPFGIDRLIQWSGGKKPVWTCIECTAISDPQRKPTPYQVRAEVWMSLIHGAKGIIYFVHVFKPKFIEAGLLEDAEMSAAINRLNREVLDLAPVLNSPSVNDAGSVASSNKDAPIDMMVKKSEGSIHIFAAAMRGADTKGAFEVNGLPHAATAEAIGEGRKIAVKDGKFTDDFKGYEAHLYKISRKK
jgi:hypothetical protein